MSDRTRYAVGAVLAGLLVPSVVAACSWDYDTIKMERTRFPGTLELITGKFLRHSPEFYRWRIDDRLKRLETAPSDAALLDDLAVAYDKTGRHDEAIETARRTERLHPGRYETAANLGTFYFHAGKFAEGLPHIDRALAINPDAHFGRERVQKRLVEYVVSRNKAGALPLADVTVHPPAADDAPPPRSVRMHNTFADFLSPESRGAFGVLDAAEAAATVKGILGMMAFGKHDSPVLLEALGACLSQGPDSDAADAKLLAARAYLKASYEVPDGPARAGYRALALHALQFQTPGRGSDAQVTIEQVEADFRKELDEGRDWYAALHVRELSWVRDGKNPEAEFDKLYAAEPEVTGLDVSDPMNARDRRLLLLIALGIILALGTAAVLAGCALLVRRHLRRRVAA